MNLLRTQNIAIVCSNYEKSKALYTQTHGLEVIREVYGTERRSHNLDL